MISYKPLWKLLVEKEMTKEQLRARIGVSPQTVSRMSSGEMVSLKIIDKICEKLDCKVEDVVEYIPGR